MSLWTSLWTTRVRRPRQAAPNRRGAGPDLHKHHHARSLAHFPAPTIITQASDLRKHGCAKCAPLRGCFSVAHPARHRGPATGRTPWIPVPPPCIGAPVTTAVDVADWTNALTRPARHEEAYTTWVGATQIVQRHRTTHASLLDQLRSAVEPSSGLGDGLRPGYGSRSPARDEAIDVLAAIGAGVAAWSLRLGVGRRGSVEERLWGLAGAWPGLLHVTATHYASDLRRWVIWARTATGWDLRAYRLNGACPACEARGGLRARLDALTAMCVECGAAWDGASGIGVLADHVRRANGEPDPEDTQPNGFAVVGS